MLFLSEGLFCFPLFATGERLALKRDGADIKTFAGISDPNAGRETLLEKTPADTKHCYWEPILEEEETTSELLWPESLGILSHLKSSWLICKNCKIPVPEFENPLIFPFHIHF